MTTEIKKGDIVTNDNPHLNKYTWYALGPVFGSTFSVHAFSPDLGCDTILDNAWKKQRG